VTGEYGRYFITGQWANYKIEYLDQFYGPLGTAVVVVVGQRCCATLPYNYNQIQRASFMENRASGFVFDDSIKFITCII